MANTPKKTETDVLMNETVGNKQIIVKKVTKFKVNDDNEEVAMTSANIEYTSLKDDGTPYTEMVTLENGQKRAVAQTRTFFMSADVLSAIISHLKK